MISPDILMKTLGIHKAMELIDNPIVVFIWLSLLFFISEDKVRYQLSFCMPQFIIIYILNSYNYNCKKRCWKLQHFCLFLLHNS